MDRRTFLLLPLLAIGDGLMPVAKAPPLGRREEDAPEQLPPPDELPLSSPEDALREAFADLKNVSVFDRPFTRWIWVQSGADEDFQAVSFALNSVSRSSVIYRPVIVGGILARIDLRWYAPRDRDIEEWLDFWEDFQFDPMLSRLITKDSIDLLNLELKVRRWKRHWTKTGEDKFGAPIWKLDERRLVTVDAKDVVVARFNTPVLEAQGYLQLQTAANSLAPIVEARYFVGRTISTINDRDKVKKDGKEVEKENLFSTVWGGRYYDLAGIRKSAVKGRTDLDQLLFDLGITEKFRVLFDRLRSDERAAMFQSQVTGKPRRIVWFGTPAARLTTASPVFFVTEDVADKDVDHGDDPVKNLVDFRVAAFEVLFTRANGTVGYALYNAKEELLDEAAPDVAADSLVPFPFTKRLQSGISCMRCHAPEDGWKPFVNQVQHLPVSIFGDVSKGELNKSIADTIDRLQGWYSGNAEGPLQRARWDTQRSALAATGQRKGHGILEAARDAYGAASRLYEQDRNDMVDAAQALRDLGLRVPGTPKAAQARLKQVLPPDLRPQVGDIIPEDVVIAGLIAGAKVLRRVWALSYSFALERSRSQKR